MSARMPDSRPFQGTIDANLGQKRAANRTRTAQWCDMDSRLGFAFGSFSLMCFVLPASAQTDGIGGLSEFRSPDRPIAGPTLPSLDGSKSSDVSRLLPTGPPTPADVLKRIDSDFARTGTGFTSEADAGQTGTTAKRGDRPNQRGLEGSTFR
jgi:hypothetical protein